MTERVLCCLWLSFALMLAAWTSARAEADPPEGVVRILVRLGNGGVVNGMRVLSEEPKGYGYAEEAMRRLEKQDFRGSRPGKYTITVRFSFEDVGDPAPAPTPTP